MSRVKELQSRYNDGDSFTSEDIRFLLDTIDCMMAYQLSEIFPPDSMCKTCEHQKEDSNPMNCEQDIEDCEEPMLTFFEKALEFWYESMEGHPSEDADNTSEGQ